LVQRASWFGAEVGSAINAEVNANLGAAGLHMHYKVQAFELTVPLRSIQLDEAALSVLIYWPSRSRRDRGSLSSVTCGSAMCRHPGDVVFVEALSYRGNRKIQKMALRRRFASHYSPAARSTA
jgi:hypothetical protein